MSTVNYTNPNTDRTVRIFDDFYKFSINIQSEEYDVVYSYFKSIYTDAQSAGNFTVTLFRIANEQSIPVLTLLEQIKTSTTSAELNVTMAYYLNSLRSSTTLLGVAQPTQPNFYVARNIKS